MAGRWGMRAEKTGTKVVVVEVVVRGGDTVIDRVSKV